MRPRVKGNSKGMCLEIGFAVFAVFAVVFFFFVVVFALGFSALVRRANGKARNAPTTVDGLERDDAPVTGCGWERNDDNDDDTLARTDGAVRDAAAGRATL